MTPESLFENPFVGPQADTDTLSLNDWEIGDWVDIGLDPRSAHLRLIMGGLRSTATKTIVEAKTTETVKPWRIEVAKDLLHRLRADQAHSISEAVKLTRSTKRN